MVGALIVAVVWCMGVVLKSDIVEVEDDLGHEISAVAYDSAKQKVQGGSDEAS